MSDDEGALDLGPASLFSSSSLETIAQENPNALFDSRHSVSSTHSLATFAEEKTSNENEISERLNGNMSENQQSDDTRGNFTAIATDSSKIHSETTGTNAAAIDVADSSEAAEMRAPRARASSVPLPTLPPRSRSDSVNFSDESNSEILSDSDSEDSEEEKIDLSVLLRQPVVQGLLSPRDREEIGSPMSLRNPLSTVVSPRISRVSTAVESHSRSSSPDRGGESALDPPKPRVELVIRSPTTPTTTPTSQSHEVSHTKATTPKSAKDASSAFPPPPMESLVSLPTRTVSPFAPPAPPRSVSMSVRSISPMSVSPAPPRVGVGVGGGRWRRSSASSVNGNLVVDSEFLDLESGE